MGQIYSQNGLKNGTISHLGALVGHYRLPIVRVELIRNQVHCSNGLNGKVDFSSVRVLPESLTERQRILPYFRASNTAQI